MKRSSSIAVRLFVVLCFSCLETGQSVVAGEALPDASLLAVRGGHSKPPQPKISDVTLTGVVQMAGSNGLTIKAGKRAKAKQQKQWLVETPSEDTEFTIRGTATLDYIKKGQIVEFTGRILEKDKIDEKGKEDRLADKVNEVTIVSRAHSSHKTNGASGTGGDPGVGERIKASKPNVDADAALTPADDAKGGSGGKAAGSKTASGAKTITGRVVSHDNKSITVTAGARTIHVDLPALPTIKVELSDPKFVADRKDSSKNKIEGKGASGRLVSIPASDLVGAKIVVSGTGSESKSGNTCLARSIEITLKSPLTGDTPSASLKKSPTEK